MRKPPGASVTLDEVTRGNTVFVTAIAAHPEVGSYSGKTTAEQVPGAPGNERELRRARERASNEAIKKLKNALARHERTQKDRRRGR